MNCICHSCGSSFPKQLGELAWRELVEGLTGHPEELELGDVIAYREDPDARPFWIWDL